MIWDAIQRRYEDENGRAVTPAEIRAHIEEYIEAEEADVEDEVNTFLEQQKSGLDTAAKAALVSILFLFLAQKIRQWHHVAGTIAYGGEDELNPERLGRIAEKVETELGFLAGFEAVVENSLVATEAITEGLSSISATITQGENLLKVETAILETPPSEVTKVLEQIVADTLKVEATEAQQLVSSALKDVPVDDLAWGSVSSRSQLYTESLYSTYEETVAAREIDNGTTLGHRVCEDDLESCDECVDAASTYFEPLENIPAIGSLQCLNNCRCFYEFAEPNLNVQLSIG